MNVFQVLRFDIFNVKNLIVQMFGFELWCLDYTNEISATKFFSRNSVGQIMRPEGGSREKENIFKMMR